MKKFLSLWALGGVLLACLGVCASCRQKQETAAGVVTVQVEDFRDKVLRLDDWVSDAYRLPLYADTLGYIGQIKDVCAVDSFLYVLDGITASLTQFHAGSGKQQRSICRRGNGPLEYIQPVALSADERFVYVLDLPGMSVIAFDETLQGVKKISLPFPCMDFVRTDDGFLCYNATPTADLGQIVYVDEAGKVRNNFLRGDVSLSFSSGTKVFMKDERNHIFINPPFSRTVYRWDSQKKEPKEYLVFDFGRKNIPADADLSRMNVFEASYVIPGNFFHVGDVALYSFLYEQKRYYAVVSSEGVQVGVVPADSGYPFFPQWQAGNRLVGTYTAQCPGAAGDDGGEVLLMFTLK